MFQAIMNVPGYLSTQDELPQFDTAQSAWEYLASQRQRDIEGYMVDDDQALKEMDGYSQDGTVGTVWGCNPSYNGDHDLGISYTVVEVTYASQSRDAVTNWLEIANLPAGEL